MQASSPGIRGRGGRSRFITLGRYRSTAVVFGIPHTVPDQMLPGTWMIDGMIAYAEHDAAERFHTMSARRSGATLEGSPFKIGGCASRCSERCSDHYVVFASVFRRCWATSNQRVGCKGGFLLFVELSSSSRSINKVLASQILRIDSEISQLLHESITKTLARARPPRATVGVCAPSARCLRPFVFFPSNNFLRSVPWKAGWCTGGCPAFAASENTSEIPWRGRARRGRYRGART